jgi:1,2-diacylglycerol 3-alpha-glucosyltransferase
VDDNSDLGCPDISARCAFGLRMKQVIRSTAIRLTKSMPGKTIVTIWNSYGPYHVARVQALRDSGFEVVPFSHCSGSEVYPFFSEEPEGHVVINDCTSSEVNRAQSFFRTLRLLNKHRPDAVLACGYERPETLAAQAYARMHRLEGGVRPKAVLMLDNQFHDSERHTAVEVVKAAYLQLFDGFIVGGPTHRDYLLRLRVPSSRIRFGYNCVDNVTIRQLADGYRRAALVTAARSKYFVCVARLVPKKNLATLLMAYKLYRAAVATGSEAWQLVICGEGPDRRILEAHVRSFELVGSVRLVGQTDRLEDTVRYLALASVFVLPSRIEPWGLVVNEAMASLLPVLVSRECGCSSELVEAGANGFTFDCNNPDELAQKMLWMQAHERDLKAMGQRSWEIVERYSPERFAASAASLLDYDVPRRTPIKLIDEGSTAT